jgi:phage shock protein E
VFSFQHIPFYDDDDDCIIFHQSLFSSSSTSLKTFLRNFIMAPASLAPDYEERAKANNFASPKEIVEALKLSGTVVLDVRTEDEIAQDRLETPDNVEWTKTGCTRTQCPALEVDASKFVKDKNCPVIVYCKSGARANRAKITLEGQGYTKVLNGGGLHDMLVYPQLADLQ